MLDVAFSRPPPVYNFRRFQVALVPEEDYIDTQIGVTTTVSARISDIGSGCLFKPARGILVMTA